MRPSASCGSAGLPRVYDFAVARGCLASERLVTFYEDDAASGARERRGRGEADDTPTHDDHVHVRSGHLGWVAANKSACKTPRGCAVLRASLARRTSHVQKLEPNSRS